MLIDSGLHSLALLAQLHRVAADAGQLQHRFGQAGKSCSPDVIIRAAQTLGFRARRLQPRRLETLAKVLPALARARDGRYFVLARLKTNADGETRGHGNAGSRSKAETQCLVLRPGEKAPQHMDRSGFESLWSGELILVAPRTSFLLRQARQFNLHWFTPALKRYRGLFFEVILASFFLQLLALATPLFFQVVMDKVLVHQGFTTLDVLALGFAVVALFEMVLGGLRNYLFSHTSHRVDVELGARLFQHLVDLPLAYFEARQVGQVVARVRELDSLRHFITGTALTLLIDLSFTFVFVAVLWYYSPALTWIVLASLPAYALLSICVTPLLRRRVDQKFHCSAVNQSFLTETVTGIQTVKSQALEPVMQRRWEDQLASYVTSSFRAQNINNIASQSAGFISKFTTLGIIWWGAHLVVAGSLSVGQLVAFNMIAGRLTTPVLKLVQLWQDFQQAGISLERLGDILNTPVEPGSEGSLSTPARINGAVRFEGVRFSYRDGGPAVLADFSLQVERGAVIGLVGRSGSGKSTVARLLQRLYVPERGRIQVDGVDLSAVDTAWLRGNIGVVQQESFLFNRTVRDNIALASPGVPFERVLRCASVAGAHAFIQDLPEGYDTLVGERGCNLSGGQRQRLAIARALLMDPRILIFDEATSALDYESERVIQENMGAIVRGRTVFIIAHRLSTVRHCDRVVVLDGGSIVEQGSHDELLAAKGYYAKLYGYQHHSPVLHSIEDGRNRDVGSAADRGMR